DVEDRQLLRQAIVGVGRVRRLLLVAERDVLDVIALARVDQRVVGVAALAEHLLDALRLQALGDVHRARQALGARGALCGHRSVHQRVSVTRRSSVISRIAYLGPSAPTPLSLTPANGIRSTRLEEASLTCTTPTCSRRAPSKA